MQNTIVKQGQSFIDVICQATGSVENIITEAVSSGKSITNDIAIGETISTTKESDMEVISILKRKNPATNGTVEMMGEELEGIGNWIINVDFIVS